MLFAMSVGGTIQGHKQYRRFLFQVTEKPMRSFLLNFTLTKKEGLIWDVKFKGSLGCSDRGMVFMIPRARRRVKSMLRTLDFRVQSFVIFKDTLEKSHRIRPRKMRGP